MAQANDTLAPAVRRIFPWPKRLDVALLSFIAVVIAYCDRVNLSVAAPTIIKEYGWDTRDMGWAFTAFFIGYTGFMIPAGRLTDFLGPRRMFAFNILWWSVFTILTPLPGQLLPLIAVRLLMGMGESGLFPAMNSMLVRWFPQQEYSRVTGFCWSGGYAGSIIGFPVASVILAQWGWPAIFYLFGFLGILWLPFWWWGVRDWPKQSTAVSHQELALIESSRPNLTRVESVPWGKLLRLPNLWAAWVLHFSSNWVTYLMVTWLPTYLSAERGFSLSSMASGAALPFVCAMVGTNFFGAAIDRLGQNHDRTLIRKWFLVPYMLSALLLLTVPAVTSPVGLVVTLCAAMFLLTSATPTYASSALDIAPRYAGTVVGMQNAFANLAGVLAPVVVGYLVQFMGWGAAFFLAAAVSALGILAYLLFGKAEQMTD